MANPDDKKNVFDDTIWGRTAAIVEKKGKIPQAPTLKTTRSGTSASRARKTAPSPAGPRQLAPSRAIALLVNRAVRLHGKGKYEEAAQLYHEALMQCGENAEAFSTDAARCLNNLGRLYHQQERYADAEPLYRRSLEVAEHIFGKQDPKVGRRLANLAELYCDWGKDSRADAYYRRALSIIEKAFGPDHPNTIKSLKGYAATLRKMNRTAEAIAVEANVLARQRPK
ncbi:MAG TPA: tetratricopeptide repeat protein [Terriglobia bacterium]